MCETGKGNLKQKLTFEKNFYLFKIIFKKISGNIDEEEDVPDLVVTVPLTMMIIMLLVVNMRGRKNLLPVMTNTLISK